MVHNVNPHVVVVGSGLAGWGVLRELRKLAPEARLTLVTQEDGHFYSKPALSTALAKGKTAETLVTSSIDKMKAQLNLDARIRREAESLNAGDKTLCTTGGPIAYDKLVLASGAVPFRPHIEGDAAHRPVSINQLDHYADFREKLADGARVLIMGSGLVGTEFANDLVTSGYKPVVVDMLHHPLGQLVPETVGAKVKDALAVKGVEWHLGRMVKAVNYTPDRKGFVATLDDGSEIEAQTVLSAVGLRPNILLAQEAGLDVDMGIKVNKYGQTSDPDIYAIGDCAQYPHGLSAYVTPIMAAARGVVPSLLGTPTAIRFPPLSVQVKTTLFPINLLPPPRGSEGTWQTIEDGADGGKYAFVDPAGIVRGYVLTQDKCQLRMEMDKIVGQGAATLGETV